MLSAGFSGDSLRDDLLKSIRDGSLRPGTRISSFRTMADQYKVSLNTVQRVIAELVDARVLEAAHGRGTFVANTKSQVKTTEFGVGIFARASGDFFGDMIDMMRNALAEQNIKPIIYDAGQERFELVCASQLKEMIQAKPKALIVDGAFGTSATGGANKAYLYNAIKRHADEISDLIVINRWDHPDRPRGNYLLFDYFDAGVQIGRYLLAMGHRSIVLNTYGVPPRKGTSEEDICRGIHSVIDTAPGMKVEYFQVPEPGEVNFDDARFQRLFKTPDHPTAVVNMADYLAEPWFERLAKIGLKVPDDVSLTGFFNTPWVKKLPVPLTSVQLNIEKLVLNTINLIQRHRNTEKPGQETIDVGASLVVRQSTAQATPV